MIHPEPHPKAGQYVIVDAGQGGPFEYRIEDWWDRVSGGSRMDADSNPACLIYAMRTAGRTPIDNEVVYGDGMLVHVSEIKEEA